MPITILDGPLGTELAARGAPTPLPAWSAAALRTSPELVADIHRAYAEAGAMVHTTGTFRTHRRNAGNDWLALTTTAIQLARSAAHPGQRIAGGVAPLEDCYRPDLSPTDALEEHRAMASALRACDLILCETFPHVGEALAALDAALETGLPVWLSFTAGPDATLLTPDEVAIGAREAARRGAAAVLVNCLPVMDTLRYVERLAEVGVPFGAYANAGYAEGEDGFVAAETSPSRYADEAGRWIDEGATIVGACCGLGPRHIAELVRRFG